MSYLRRVKQAHKERGLRYVIGESLHIILHKLIPNRIVWRILPERKTKRVIARSRILSAIFFLINGTFYLEQRAVLNGQVIYRDQSSAGGVRSRAIRNTHRIEKGLTMKDRRAVFAEGYIDTLVSDAIELASECGSIEEDEQLQWMLDVLDEYFNVASTTEIIENAEHRYRSLLKETSYEPGHQRPLPREELENASISYKEIQKLAQQRTSTRWFEQQPVPRELLDNAMQVAAQSPSACNRQSFEFRFYDDDELVDEISKHSIGVDGYRENIPCIAAIVGKYRAYSSVRDKHLVYIDASLAAMSFQFALETMGLGSCCINWPAIPRRQRAMHKTLDLDDDETVIMLMAIGYPESSESVPYSEKRNLDQLRSYNR